MSKDNSVSDDVVMDVSSEEQLINLLDLIYTELSGINDGFNRIIDLIEKERSEDI